MGQPASFWDKIADGYARRPIADEAAYQRKLEVTREHFRPDSEVLEFGCGTGGTAISHAPFVKHVRATDISARMLEIAREKAAAAGVENVTFEQVTIEDLEAPEASLDVVLGLSILHLLQDPGAAIAKVHEWLKPGGVFVTSTICLGDHMNFMRPLLAVGRFFGLVPYVRFMKRADLEAGLADAGFSIDHA